MKLPVTRRARSESGLRSTPVTLNDGAVPVTSPSARSVSPSLAKASSRICEHPGGDLLIGADREVPGEIEVRAVDPGRAQVLEDPLEAAALLVDRGLAGGQVIAVVAEALGRRDRLARGVLQVAQCDDVAMLGGEVLRRVDEQRGLLGGRGVRVDLDPDRPALAGGGVDHDHRGVAVGVSPLVVDRDRVRLGQRRRVVETRHPQDDRLPGAEPVGSRVGGRVDVDVGGVGRHRIALEVDPPARVRARLLGGIEVVGEGQHAERALLLADEVALRGAGEVDRLRLTRGGVADQRGRAAPDPALTRRVRPSQLRISLRAPRPQRQLHRLRAGAAEAQAARLG